MTSVKQVVIQDYQSLESLHHDAVKDLAIAVSKMAASWMKLRIASMAGQSAGPFELDLGIMYGMDDLLNYDDCETVADLAQRELDRFVPCRYGYNPTVNLDFSTGSARIYVGFLER